MAESFRYQLGYNHQMKLFLLIVIISFLLRWLLTHHPALFLLSSVAGWVFSHHHLGSSCERYLFSSSAVLFSSLNNTDTSFCEHTFYFFKNLLTTYVRNQMDIRLSTHFGSLLLTEVRLYSTCKLSRITWSCIFFTKWKPSFQMTTNCHLHLVTP